MIPALVFTACIVAAGALAVRYVRWLRASGRRHDDLMAVAEAARVTPRELADMCVADLVAYQRMLSAADATGTDHHLLAKMLDFARIEHLAYVDACGAVTDELLDTYATEES